MFVHTDKISAKKRFETKIAWNSKTAWKLLNKWKLETVKVGAISSNQRDRVLPKPIGRTRACVKKKSRMLLHSCYDFSTGHQLDPLLNSVGFGKSVDTSILKKWPKQTRETSLQKYMEQGTQLKKKEALFVQEINRRWARFNIRLRDLEKVYNRITKQFSTETRYCRDETALSDYLLEEKLLTACFAHFVRQFRSTLLKKATISQNFSWQSSVETARKIFFSTKTKWKQSSDGNKCIGKQR